LRGKEDQIEQWQAGLRRDARLCAAFDEQCRRLSAMVLFVEGDAVVNETRSRFQYRAARGQSSGGGNGQRRIGDARARG
jgi:hypothetical protein